MTENCYFFGTQSVTSANLTVGPPDAENQVYASGDAPFALGAEVWDDGHVFRSKVDSNSAALTDAASWDDLGEVDEGALLYAAGTTYAEGDWAVLNGRLWLSAQASNTGNTPAVGSTFWTNAGPTTRFRAFDLNSTMPALLKGSITWTFTAAQTLNSMLIILPKGGFANVYMEDAEGNELFDQQFRLTRDSGGGPYNHDFSPIESTSRVIVHGLPPGAGNVITVTITGGATQMVGAGQIAFGFAHAFGTVVTGSTAAVIGLREPVEDQFGNITFPNRPTRRRARFAVSAGNKQNDRILSLAAQYINKPAGMYMVDGENYGLCVYGFVREVDLPMNNPVLTDALIEIKGFAE